MSPRLKRLFRSQNEETPDLKKSEKKRGGKGLAIIRGNSGPTPVARGGCGAKAPPLAVRPGILWVVATVLSSPLGASLLYTYTYMLIYISICMYIHVYSRTCIYICSSMQREDEYILHASCSSCVHYRMAKIHAVPYLERSCHICIQYPFESDHIPSKKYIPDHMNESCRTYEGFKSHICSHESRYSFDSVDTLFHRHISDHINRHVAHLHESLFTNQPNGAGLICEKL